MRTLPHLLALVLLLASHVAIAQDAAAPVDATASPPSTTATATAPGTAPAPSDANNEARAEFERGLQLLDDTRYAEAATALERSVALREGASALYNLALAYRGMGAYRRAIAVLVRVEGLPGTDAHMLEEAHAVAEELRRALVRVRLHVQGESTSVLIDGVSVGEADGTFAVELDPGTHLFEARRAGYRRASESQTLAPGATAAVELDVSTDPLPARLRIQVNERDAQIFVDGTMVGQGMYHASFAPGPHEVEVRAGGRQPQRRTVTLVPGSRERLVIAMPPRPPSIARNPWLWAGVGAVVVAAVVTIVAVSAPTAHYYDGTFGFTVQAVSAR